jgi:hypothetical protein
LGHSAKLSRWGSCARWWYRYCWTKLNTGCSDAARGDGDTSSYNRNSASHHGDAASWDCNSTKLHDPWLRIPEWNPKHYDSRYNYSKHNDAWHHDPQFNN